MKALHHLLVPLSLVIGINGAPTTNKEELEKRALRGSSVGAGITVIAMSFAAAHGGHSAPAIPRNCTASKFEAYVYFRDPTEPGTLLAIDTPWYCRYGLDLSEKALPKAGFEKLPSDYRPPRCGWQWAGGVTKNAVWRGQYAYHNTMINGTLAERPSDETFERITRVLEDTYPTAEIVMIVVFTAICPILLVTIIMCCRSRRRYIC